MKFTVSFFLIILLSFVACIYFPWWSIAIVAFMIAALIPMKPGTAFLAGSTALLLLWGGLAFWLSASNGYNFAQKISLLIIKINNPALMIGLTALIGSIVAGMGALTGSYFRRIFSEKRFVPAHDHQL